MRYIRNVINGRHLKMSMCNFKQRVIDRMNIKELTITEKDFTGVRVWHMLNKSTYVVCHVRRVAGVEIPIRIN